MAKAPKPGTGRKVAGEPEDGDDGLKLTVTLDGERHVALLDKVTPRDVIALRAAVGIGVFALARRIATEGTEIDTAAAVLWLARRQNGEPKLPFDVVANDLTFGAILSPAEVTNAVEDDDPE